MKPQQNNNEYSKNILPGPSKTRSCTKFIIGFSILFVLFWIFIIFIVSRRDKPLDIHIYADESSLPVIEPKYTEGDGVPRLFHQLWKSKELPEKWKDNHIGCIALNPDFKLILWTDEMIYNFIFFKYQWFYRLFVGYPYHIQRVDVARYFILYHYGGVYLDIDATCKVPFKEVISNMAKVENTLIPSTDIHGVTNSFMVAKSGTKFFRYVTYELPSYASGPYTLIRHTTIIFSTGPMFLSHCVETFTESDDIHILSIPDYDEKYFTHAKGGSWHSWDTEIVDVFHFHYVALVIIFVIVLGIFLYLKYQRNYCCLS